MLAEIKKKMKLLAPLFLVAIVSCCSACPWKDGDNGQVNWALGCDFYGSDYASVANTPGSQCGRRCISDGRCTHFTWADVEGGTCYLKENRRNRKEIESAFSNRDRTGPTVVCGYVNARINGQNRCPWKDGNGDQVGYDLDCDFFGNDIASVDGRGEDCGGACLHNGSCTHFTWFNNKCYLKRASKSGRRASFRRINGAVCGFVKTRTNF